MFVRAKKRGEVTYLQIVENQWRDGRVTQTILHSLGRLDELNGTGALDRFLTSATRFSRNLAVLNAHERGESVTTRTSIIGPQLIFERLWRELSIDKVIAAVARGRSFGFSLERAIYLTVLHRLCVSGSDRAAETWKSVLDSNRGAAVMIGVYHAATIAHPEIFIRSLTGLEVEMITESGAPQSGRHFLFLNPPGGAPVTAAQLAVSALYVLALFFLVGRFQ